MKDFDPARQCDYPEGMIECRAGYGPRVQYLIDGCEQHVNWETFERLRYAVCICYIYLQ